MKKKTRVTAARTAKRRRSGRAVGKVAPPRTTAAKAPAPRSRPPAASDPTRPALRRLRAQLARAQARINELEAAADIDFLLEIPNRRGFERELDRAIAYIKRYQASGALILLDVDRLKPINDAFGHAAGDQVLKAIVAALLRHVRASDVIGRLGGDEFATAVVESQRDRRSRQGGVAGTGGRSAQLRVWWPHGEGGRLRRRRYSRPPQASRPRPGTSRQRDVYAQGAAAA